MLARYAKRMKQFRLTRQKIYEGLFGARALFITGLLIMPAILFNPGVLARAGNFLFFWFLCWLAGKKNNALLTILVFLSIVIFNLIIPYGRVLFTIGFFRVTQGALSIGIQRAATFEGLIMLSRISIRGDLKIPGSFGGIIAESFRYFNLIINSKNRITVKNLAKDIDELLIDLSENKTPAPAAVIGGIETTPTQLTKPLGYVILSALVILSWTIFFLSVFVPL